MKVIFGSVIYSDAVIYAADFLRSLNNQTDRDFSLLLINDGYCRVDFYSFDCSIA